MVPLYFPDLGGTLPPPFKSTLQKYTPDGVLSQYRYCFKENLLNLVHGVALWGPSLQKVSNWCKAISLGDL